MLSRIFWVGLAGAALIAGMALQDGDRIFGSADHGIAIERAIEADVEQTVEAEVQRSVEGRSDNMQVVGPDGREVDVPREHERALAGAVGALIKAEARLAALRIADGTTQELEAAETARDHARAEVDRHKAEIQRHERATEGRDTLGDQIRREVREDVRDTIREAVRN